MNKKILAILALLIVAASISAVSAFGLSDIFGGAQNETVTVDGVDFNVPAGFNEDPTNTTDDVVKPLKDEGAQISRLMPVPPPVILSSNCQKDPDSDSNSCSASLRTSSSSLRLKISSSSIGMFSSVTEKSLVELVFSAFAAEITNIKNTRINNILKNLCFTFFSPPFLPIKTLYFKKNSLM